MMVLFIYAVIARVLLSSPLRLDVVPRGGFPEPARWESDTYRFPIYVWIPDEYRDGGAWDAVKNAGKVDGRAAACLMFDASATGVRFMWLDSPIANVRVTIHYSSFGEKAPTLRMYVDSLEAGRRVKGSAGAVFASDRTKNMNAVTFTFAAPMDIVTSYTLEVVPAPNGICVFTIDGASIEGDR